MVSTAATQQARPNSLCATCSILEYITFHQCHRQQEWDTRLHTDCNNQSTMQVKKNGGHQLFYATRTHAHLLMCIAKLANICLASCTTDGQLDHCAGGFFLKVMTYSCLHTLNAALTQLTLLRQKWLPVASWLQQLVQPAPVGAALTDQPWPLLLAR